MIMAGGTGGHVFPALAIAGELRASRNIVWLGTERGIESRLVPAAGYAVEWIEVEGLRGKGLGRWLAAPLRIARAVAQARRALRRRDRTSCSAAADSRRAPVASRRGSRACRS
jgi:UDP-N-acetylglucosamine--N-acetylmuramyl-(pentapeptide) pyrophosphoryl-undecaprenol N-acetylglucosamine transferase